MRGRFTRGDPDIRAASEDSPQVEIGAFSSIGADVVIRAEQPPGDVVVGDDVWIGERTVVLPGVRIGTGAVVLPGSEVAADVPPYAVVAGAPARAVRCRFDDDVARRLLESRWWTWPRNVVAEFSDLLCEPPRDELFALAAEVDAVRGGRSDGRRFHRADGFWDDQLYQVWSSPGFGWNRVVVVVACFEHARFVEEALDSVARQTFRDMTVVVTDDASGDRTSEIAVATLSRSTVPSWVVARRRENAGLPTVLDDVLHSTDSGYLAFLGGDDLWEPEKLRRQVEHMDRPGEVAAVVSDAHRIGSSVGSQFERYGYDPGGGTVEIERLVSNYPVAACTPLYSVGHLRLVGGWDPSLSYEDQDMMLKLADFARIDVMPERLASHRFHDATSSQVHARSHLLSRYRLLVGWLGRTPSLDREILAEGLGIAERLYRAHGPFEARPLVEDLHARWPTLRSRVLLELASRGVDPATMTARISAKIARTLTP